VTVTTSTDERTVVEELKLHGNQVLAQIRELIHEGNVRRITIKNDEGRTVLEIPLTIGVAGALLVPTLAAIGAVAALLTECSIEVVKVIPEPEPEPIDAAWESARNEPDLG
jgi:hypothetical protein